MMSDASNLNLPPIRPATTRRTVCQAPPQPKSQALRIVSVIVVGMVICTLIVVGSVYWVSTAPERIERRATESLENRAWRETLELERVSGLVELRNDHWAKSTVKIVENNWELIPNKSQAYPYKGEIRISFRCFATIYHSTKEDAEADESFYETYAEYMYQSKPEFYLKPSFTQSKVLKLLYDPREDEWIAQGNTF